MECKRCAAEYSVDAAYIDAALAHQPAEPGLCAACLGEPEDSAPLDDGDVADCIVEEINEIMSDCGEFLQADHPVDHCKVAGMLLHVASRVLDDGIAKRFAAGDLACSFLLGKMSAVAKGAKAAADDMNSIVKAVDAAGSEDAAIEIADG